MSNKTKILWLSDHALMNSGVATQSKFLSEALVSTGRYSIYQLGAAAKHAPDTKTITLSEDWIIEPTTGFGTKDKIRQMLIQWKPDVIFIFTDPRFFTWLFEIEDEIHQVCPIVWWHVWDNYPFPEFNRGYYNATDAINCHSYLTYEMLKDNGYSDKTQWIPHALPQKYFYPKPDISKQMAKEKYAPHHVDSWTVFWNNKNFGRKRPGDLIVAWSKFISLLEEKHGHRKACLFLHTDPKMTVGANFVELAKFYHVEDTVCFSTGQVATPVLNDFYNMADVTINIAHSEGFGLSTLESMMTGTPIIAPMTGGQIRQIIDHKDGTENGRALPIEMTLMNSSQSVPYIFEDYCSNETIANKLLEMYELTDEEKKELSQKVLTYANSEFSFDVTVSKWDESIQETVRTWKSKYEAFTVEKL